MAQTNQKNPAQMLESGDTLAALSQDIATAYLGAIDHVDQETRIFWSDQQEKMENKNEDRPNSDDAEKNRIDFYLRALKGMSDGFPEAVDPSVLTEMQDRSEHLGIGSGMASYQLFQEVKAIYNDVMSSSIISDEAKENWQSTLNVSVSASQQSDQSVERMHLYFATVMLEGLKSAKQDHPDAFQKLDLSPLNKRLGDLNGVLDQRDDFQLNEVLRLENNLENIIVRVSLDERLPADLAEDMEDAYEAYQPLSHVSESERSQARSAYLDDILNVVSEQYPQVVKEAREWVNTSSYDQVMEEHAELMNEFSSMDAENDVAQAEDAVMDPKEDLNASLQMALSYYKEVEEEQKMAEAEKKEAEKPIDTSHWVKDIEIDQKTQNVDKVEKVAPRTSKVQKESSEHGVTQDDLLSKITEGFLEFSKDVKEIFVKPSVQHPSQKGPLVEKGDGFFSKLIKMIENFFVDLIRIFTGKTLDHAPKEKVDIKVAGKMCARPTGSKDLACSTNDTKMKQKTASKEAKIDVSNDGPKIG